MYVEGSWYGNRTISRTIEDLNKIVFYADKNGTMSSEKQRSMLIVADMIISGEGEGAIESFPKEIGIIMTGTDSVCFDYALCTLMGFDLMKIPTIQSTICQNDVKYGLASNFNAIRLKSNDARYNDKFLCEIKLEDMLGYEPSEGWKNHIELQIKS